MLDVVLMADPAVMGIPVVDNGEPLVDLRDYGTLRLDNRLADPAGAYCQARRGVADRLVAAQRLLPGGLHFLVVEAYRPLALQVQYFESYLAELRAENPSWSDQHLRTMASRLLSPPEIGPHVCGAAIDLTLCSPGGEEIWLGTEVNDGPEESDDACYTAATNIPAQARRHRRVLANAMTSAGFVNYPTEWWHWSYGDRYWAMTTAAPHAIYGQQTFTGR
ncbi:M15 family metallopeptidase [Kribbella sp. NBC_01245]|uniref:M15 family metallopeptidase n=1 Tax=Kribbella sp. NBC_01245 TaxID=2903578 RepID=UPI002E2A46A0|nr:M15 family metallopeptidase [Kribbella sp. NBC_01245]